MAVIVFIGLMSSLLASALTPPTDEVWGEVDGIVLEGTEWIEYDDSYESCEYDEVWDEYYDCYWIYEYNCYADVYYNYSVSGFEYYAEYELWLGTWDDYCLEIVEFETLPENSTVNVWYKFDDNAVSQLEKPNDIGALWSFIGLCCFLPILIVLLIFMYFDGNNDEYENSDSNNGNETHHHHYHHGGGIFGGVYYGSPWYRRPWFHRRRSRRITRRTSRSSRSSSGGGRRSSGGGRRSSGGGRRSGGGGRRSR